MVPDNKIFQDEQFLKPSTFHMQRLSFEKKGQKRDIWDLAKVRYIILGLENKKQKRQIFKEDRSTE